MSDKDLQGWSEDLGSLSAAKFLGGSCGGRLLDSAGQRCIGCLGIFKSLTGTYSFFFFHCCHYSDEVKLSDLAPHLRLPPSGQGTADV